MLDVTLVSYTKLVSSNFLIILNPMKEQLKNVSLIIFHSNLQVSFFILPIIHIHLMTNKRNLNIVKAQINCNRLQMDINAHYKNNKIRLLPTCAIILYFYKKRMGPLYNDLVDS